MMFFVHVSLQVAFLDILQDASLVAKLPSTTTGTQEGSQGVDKDVGGPEDPKEDPKERRNSSMLQGSCHGLKGQKSLKNHSRPPKSLFFAVIATSNQVVI